MKRILTLLLLLTISLSLSAQVATNQDVARAIVKSSIQSSGTLLTTDIQKSLIELITFALDEKDKTIDYNAAIADTWKSKFEKQKTTFWGFSLGVQLQGFSPQIGGSFILLF